MSSLSRVGTFDPNFICATQNTSISGTDSPKEESNSWDAQQPFSLNTQEIKNTHAETTPWRFSSASLQTSEKEKLPSYPCARGEFARADTLVLRFDLKSGDSLINRIFLRDNRITITCTDAEIMGNYFKACGFSNAKYSFAKDEFPNLASLSNYLTFSTFDPSEIKKAIEILIENNTFSPEDLSLLEGKAKSLFQVPKGGIKV